MDPLEKINKMMELMQNETLTPAEVEKLITMILEFISKAKKGFDTVSESNLQKMQDFLDNIRSEHRDIMGAMLQESKDVLAKCDKMCKEVLNAKPKDGVSPDLQTIAYEASKLVDDKLRPLVPKIEDIEKDLPKLGEPIRDSLEILKGEDRLDKSAIRGLDDYEDVKKLAKQKSESGQIRGSRGVDLSIDGTVIGAVQYLNLIAGIGVTLTHVVTGGRNDVVINASASTSVLTATGTIDDSNVAFTFISEPAILIINGASYRQTGGAITWTWDSGTLTATLSSPIGSSGSLFGLA